MTVPLEEEASYFQTFKSPSLAAHLRQKRKKQKNTHTHTHTHTKEKVKVHSAQLTPEDKRSFHGQVGLRFVDLTQQEAVARRRAVRDQFDVLRHRRNGQSPHR